MAIRFHEGDLPEGYDFGAAWRSTPRRWGWRSAATGFASCSSAAATATPRWCGSPPGQRAAPRLTAMLGDPKVLKLFHFGRFDMARAGPRLRRDAGAGLLHQDRLEAGAHLHRPARAEGSRQGAARRRSLQAAAKLGLGRGALERGAARLRRLRRAAPARACAKSSTRCWRARAATASRARLSPICPSACGSISRASRRWTCFRTARPEPPPGPEPGRREGFISSRRRHRLGAVAVAVRARSCWRSCGVASLPMQ